jgi:hypothetical protein
LSVIHDGVVGRNRPPDWANADEAAGMYDENAAFVYCNFFVEE